MTLAGALSFLPPLKTPVSHRRRRADSDNEMADPQEVPSQRERGDKPIRPLPTHSSLFPRGQRAQHSTLMGGKVLEPSPNTASPTATTSSPDSPERFSPSAYSSQTAFSSSPRSHPSASVSAAGSPSTLVEPLAPQDIPLSFPFYSSELSKPFFSFNPAEDSSANNELLQQQLDQLEAMLGINTQPGQGGTESGNMPPTATRTGEALERLFGFAPGGQGMYGQAAMQQSPLNPTGHAHGRMVGANAGMGSAVGGEAGIHHRESSPLWSFDCCFLLMTVTENDGTGHGDLGNSLLDFPGASVWAGVPAGLE